MCKKLIGNYPAWPFIFRLSYKKTKGYGALYLKKSTPYLFQVCKI